MHSDRTEWVHCGWDVLAIAKVHDGCGLLLIRPTTSPCRLVLNTICCNMLKSACQFCSHLFSLMKALDWVETSEKGPVSG